MSNKKQGVIAKELGVKERHLSEMINGCNSLKSNITTIANYFNVKEDLFYVIGQVNEARSS
jgi:plasmid maintenance system antidote protein VapI